MGGNVCSKTYKTENINSFIIKRVDNNTYLNNDEKSTEMKDVSIANFGSNKEKFTLTMFPYVSGTAPDPNAGKKSGNKYVSDCPKNARITIYSFRKVGGVTPFRISTPLVSEKKETSGFDYYHRILTYKGGQFAFIKEQIKAFSAHQVDTDSTMNGKLFHALKTKVGDYVLQVYGTKMFLGVTKNGILIPIPPGGTPLGKVVAIKPEEFGNNLKQYKMAFSDATITYDNQNGPIVGQPTYVSPEVYPENPNDYVPPTPDEVPDEPEGITTTKQPGNAEVTEMAFPDAKTNLSPEQQESVQNPTTEQQQENTERELFSSIEGTEIGIIVTLVLLLVVGIALLAVFLRKNPSQ